MLQNKSPISGETCKPVCVWTINYCAVYLLNEIKNVVIIQNSIVKIY